jgi:hypothetical protein
LADCKPTGIRLERQVDCQLHRRNEHGDIERIVALVDDYLEWKPPGLPLDINPRTLVILSATRPNAKPTLERVRTLMLRSR